MTTTNDTTSQRNPISVASRLRAVAAGEEIDGTEIWWCNMPPEGPQYRDGDEQGMLDVFAWGRTIRLPGVPLPDNVGNLAEWFDEEGRYTGPNEDGIYPIFRIVGPRPLTTIESAYVAAAREGDDDPVLVFWRDLSALANRAGENTSETVKLAAIVLHTLAGLMQVGDHQRFRALAARAASLAEDRAAAGRPAEGRS